MQSYAKESIRVNVKKSHAETVVFHSQAQIYILKSWEALLFLEQGFSIALPLILTDESKVRVRSIALHWTV